MGTVGTVSAPSTGAISW